MIVKFFDYGQGTSGGIDYLLNHRKEDGTALVKKGDPNLTKKLIQSISTKQKYKSGVLSFSEKEISEKVKYTLMSQFEKLLFSGLTTAQFNTLWVEHRDKDRVELHFVIPRLELLSQKAINPYFAKIDQKRVDTWKNIINLKYGFSNPNDALKKRAVSGNPKATDFTTYEMLDSYLQQKVKEGFFTSRDKIVKHLNEINFQITRLGDNYISVQIPGMKKSKRFKGTIYSKEFITPNRDQFIEQSSKADNEVSELIASLKLLQDKKAAYNQKRYPQPVQNNTSKIKKYKRKNINHDSIRNKTIERIRKTRKAQSRALSEDKRIREHRYNHAKHSRQSLFDRIKSDRATIYQKQRRARNSTSKFESARREIGSISEKLSEFGTEIEHFIKHFENIQDLKLRESGHFCL